MRSLAELQQQCTSLPATATDLLEIRALLNDQIAYVLPDRVVECALVLVAHAPKSPSSPASR